MTVDTLVAVLQDPDRGAPRATVADLQDVKTHRGEAHKYTVQELCSFLDNPFLPSR